jgi:serine/threonine protein kinase
VLRAIGPHNFIPAPVASCSVDESSTFAIAYPFRSGTHSLPEESHRKRYFSLLLKAIAFTHTRGFVHGDVHPGNVLFDQDLGTLALIDWDEAASIGSKYIGGPPAFFNPFKSEQYYGRKASFTLNTGVDLWSFMVMLAVSLLGVSADELDAEAVSKLPLRLSQGGWTELAAMLQANDYSDTVPALTLLLESLTPPTTPLVPRPAAFRSPSPTTRDFASCLTFPDCSLLQ